MHKLGFIVLSDKKNFYVNDHERSEVVEYGNNSSVAWLHWDT